MRGWANIDKLDLAQDGVMNTLTLIPHHNALQKVFSIDDWETHNTVDKFIDNILFVVFDNCPLQIEDT